MNFFPNCQIVHIFTFRHFKRTCPKETEEYLISKLFVFTMFRIIYFKINILRKLLIHNDFFSNGFSGSIFFRSCLLESNFS